MSKEGHGIERFHLESQEYTETGKTKEKPVEESATEEELEAKAAKEAAAVEAAKDEGGKEKPKEEDQKVFDEAKTKADELEKVPEKDRTEDDNKFLESFNALKEQFSDVDSPTGYGQLMKQLDEQAIITLDKEEQYDDTVEGFAKAINDEREQAIDKYIENLPDQLKAVIKHVADNGGDLGTYIQAITEEDYAAVDMNVESNQRSMISVHLSSLGDDDATIQKKIDLYEDNGLRESEATKAQKILADARAARIKTVEESQKTVADANATKQADDRDAFVQAIDTTEKIAGIEVNKREVQQLKAYMTNIVKEGKTQWQLDSSNMEEKIKSAYFQMKGYNIKTIGTKARSEAVTNVRNLLNKTGDVHTKSVGSGVGHVDETKKGKKGEAIKVTGLPWFPEVEAD